ncbi:hypothetical protein Bca101_074697 [Brassica carinata]
MILGQGEAELSKQARATTKVRDSRRHSGLTTGQPKILCRSAQRRSSPEPKAPNDLLCKETRSSDKVNLHDDLYIVYLQETEKRNLHRPMDSKPTTKVLENGTLVARDLQLAPPIASACYTSLLLQRLNGRPSFPLLNHRGTRETRGEKHVGIDGEEKDGRQRQKEERKRRRGGEEEWNNKLAVDLLHRNKVVILAALG